jgi:prolyl-tRNA editing enzyme YbaK/EbsC (Cys-tRNA(Pro) deacylase)
MSIGRRPRAPCLIRGILLRVKVMNDEPTATTQIDQRVKSVLDSLSLPYEIVEIDPAFADTAQFCEHYGFPLEQSANTIIVGSKKEPKQYAACVVRANTRLDVNHVVRKLMGVARLSFATADETMALTGMMIGGVTVFALPEGLPIYVDDGLMPLDYIILGGGSRSTKVKIAPAAVTRLPGAQIIAGLSAVI